MLPPMPEGIDDNEIEEIDMYSNQNESTYRQPIYQNGRGGRGRLGPSDLRNVASDTPVIALAVGLASGATELANQLEPSGSIATHGLIGWLIPFMIALLLKVVAAVFRTHGQSWFEKLGTKLWHIFNEKKRKQSLVAENGNSVTLSLLRAVPFYTFMSLIFGVILWVTLSNMTEIEAPWLVLIASTIGGITADIVKSRV